MQEVVAGRISYKVWGFLPLVDSEFPAGCPLHGLDGSITIKNPHSLYGTLFAFHNTKICSQACVLQSTTPRDKLAARKSFQMSTSPTRLQESLVNKLFSISL